MENTVRFCEKGKQVAALERNNRYLVWESYKTNKSRVFGQMQFVNAVSGGTYSDTKTYPDVTIKYAQSSVYSLINRRQ